MPSKHDIESLEQADEFFQFQRKVYHANRNRPVYGFEDLFDTFYILRSLEQKCPNKIRFQAFRRDSPRPTTMSLRETRRI